MVLSRKKNNRHYSYDLAAQYCLIKPRCDIWRATIIIQKTKIDLNKWASRDASKVAKDTIIRMDTITMKNTNLDWFNSLLSFSDSTSILKTYITHGTELAVSDGSYYPTEEVGACAWTIYTLDEKEWVN